MKNQSFLVRYRLIRPFFTILIISTGIFAQSAKTVEQTKPEINTLSINTPKSLSTEVSTKESAAISELSHKAFNLLNQQRVDNGLKPLRWNEDLAKAAQFHSENMARYNFFSHRGQDGLTVQQRAEKFKFSQWRFVGENIGYVRGYSKPADSACEMWMSSPGHRANILNKDWTESAVGVAMSAEGRYYFTQIFA